MATKKKAKPDPVPVAAPAPVESALQEWAVNTLTDVKGFRANATGSDQRVALDKVLVSIRVLLAAIEAK